ncbi:MAG: DUF4870 domain-containing protein [Planctomycetota bacterium]|nr:DUF4870 domain-containing protein [Planctomycetota bacterium]
MTNLTNAERPEMDQREINQWCMFMHLGLLAGYVVPLGGFIVPIVLWQLKKDVSPQIDQHGRLVASAMVAFVLYGILAGLLILVVVGVFLLPVVGICGVLFPIIGGMKANDGEYWPYPLVPRLF